MDFFVALALYASSQGISQEEMTVRHANYCQNLYFQPQAEYKMRKAHCDMTATSEEIARVKSGKY